LRKCEQEIRKGKSKIVILDGERDFIEERRLELIGRRDRQYEDKK
jgi:hypothetical protein